MEKLTLVNEAYMCEELHFPRAEYLAISELTVKKGITQDELERIKELGYKFVDFEYEQNKFDIERNKELTEDERYNELTSLKYTNWYVKYKIKKMGEKQ